MRFHLFAKNNWISTIREAMRRYKIASAILHVSFSAPLRLCDKKSYTTVSKRSRKVKDSFDSFLTQARILGQGKFRMQKGHILQFDCQQCKEMIEFSIFELEKNGHLIQCSSCKKKYILNDETLLRQLKKFALLCRQIIDSEEILSNTIVGIDIGEKNVKIPYKLLLTRFTSSLDLIMGNQPVSIRFRIEPLKDMPKEV